MDTRLLREILDFDSTSGSERPFSEFLAVRLMNFFEGEGASVPVLSRYEVGDGTENLLFAWGKPELVYCTHIDTVPPYIAPKFVPGRVLGRGSNDAKGQLFSLACACARLSSAGRSGFGLLLVSGEETGSFGAKAFAKIDFCAPYLIVGEPTENKMVSASKGTRSFRVHVGGKRCHSGYPENGVSAVMVFHELVSRLKATVFPLDPLLGTTSWNIGQLQSPNPQNILSDSLDCRIYFRTTFASEAIVDGLMSELGEMEYVEIEALGGDMPRKYMTLDGFESAPVSFGSDAPHLTNFEHRAICGPGSILTAHTDDEYVELADLETAVEQYVMMFERLFNI